MSIEYTIHDGSTWQPHNWTDCQTIHNFLDLARSAAHEERMKAGAAHAIYGVKHYDLDTGILVKADIYCPAVLLNDDEFDKRTAAQCLKSPCCYILALHAR